MSKFSREYKFQYMSDLHLEYYKNKTELEKFVFPCGPYLILAGDIGNPFHETFNMFFDIISPLYKAIFYVPGNHEYYSNYFQDYAIYNIYKKNRNDNKTTWIEYVDNKIEQLLAKYSNVIFLQNSVYHFPDSKISIFASTFWSVIPKNKYDEIKNRSDYKCIPEFTPKYTNKLHKFAVKTLKRAIKESPNRTWLVISHHLPQTKLIHQMYKNYEYNYAFASDIKIATSPKIIAWIYGHTHNGSVIEKYYCNPIGYPNENINYTLDKMCIIID